MTNKETGSSLVCVFPMSIYYNSESVGSGLFLNYLRKTNRGSSFGTSSMMPHNCLTHHIQQWGCRNVLQKTDSVPIELLMGLFESLLPKIDKIIDKNQHLFFLLKFFIIFRQKFEQ